MVGPAQYFRPFGMAAVALGVVGVLVARPWRTARWWLVGSAVSIALEGISSRLYFWPRNEILFVEGSAVHPVEVLRRVSDEFQAWHWFRVLCDAAAAACVLVGFLRFHRRQEAWR